MKQFYTVFIFLFLSLLTTAQTPTGSSTEVGITNGELSVSLSGAANYTIPIAVPPGINDIVPQISLVYNSQGTNGIAGYRWNIAGISAITRIPSTKFHDGIINPIGGSVFDRFALDGQRLLKKGGGNYFEPGGGWGANVYELENFSNIKITSANNTANPSTTAAFRVEYPDGSFAIYTLKSNQTNLVYAISYWENAQGVRISYEYNDVAGKKLTIASIKYGSTTTNAPINEIQFIYESRSRPEQGYFLGKSLTDDTILSKIKVIGNGVGFRNYELKYDETFLKYQRLISITESNGDNTRSYNPTKFEYEKTVESETIEAKPTTTTIGMSNINSDTSKTITGDFDGDGKMDFALYPTKGDMQKKKFWLFTDINNSFNNFPREAASGSFEEIFPGTFLHHTNKISESQGIIAVQSATDSKAVNFNTYYNSIYGVGIIATKQITFPVRNIPDCVSAKIKSIDKSQSKTYISGDFNGDGLTDIIAIDNQERKQTGTCVMPISYISTGKVYFIDLDRRKTSDFWIEAGTLLDNFSNYKTFSEKDRIETFDVNGDGKTDILHFKKGSVTVYSLDNSNKLSLLWKTTDENIVPNMSILPGDYNGDGKMDFIIPKSVGLFNSNDYFKFLSTGSSFEKFSQWYDFPNYGSSVISESGGGVSVNYLIPLDFNGDGKTDIVHFRSIYGNTAKQGAIIIRSFNNNGTAFGFSSESYIRSTSLIKSYAAPIFLSPNTNNQYVEVGAITDNLIYTFNSQKNFSKETLLSKIITGNGAKETITYSSLKQDQYESFYIPESYVETFPNIDIKVAPNFKIVTKLEKESASNYSKQLFNYHGAVSNAEGLGFIGFRTILRTNWHNETTPLISNISKYDISKRGAEIENYSVLGLRYITSSSPDSFIKKSVIDYNTAAEALQTNKVFKLIKKSIKEYNGLENTSSETNTDYDVYSNPTKSTIYLKENGTTVQTTTTSLTYKDPTPKPYFVGRLASKTQDISITGSTMSTEEKYDYTDNGLLKEIKKKGTGTGYITETNNFDAFGNVTKKIISADDIYPRETSYEYDPSGRFLIKSTDATGLFKTFAYNLNNGCLTSETNEYGLTTGYEYDSWLNKTQTTDYLGNVNKFIYTKNSEKTIVTKIGDDGSESEETFDDLGRKIKKGVKNINGTFSYVSYLYDALDRNYKVSEPYFGTNPTDWNETIYDEYGRIKTSIAFTGKTVQFSYSGLTTVADEGYKSKSTTKNVIGNIVSMTDSPGGTITYKYFADGNLMESDFGGAKTIITQDGWGRKTSLKDPSAGTYSYAYNSLGEVTSETTPNGIITYKLSPLGRVIEKTIVGTNTNSKTTYSYDDKMLLSLSKFDDLTNGANTITNTYTYDGYKRISSVKETTPYAEFIKVFRYDAFGRIEFEKSTAKAAGKESVKEIKNTYLNGAHSQILDNDTNTVLWKTIDVDAKGQLKEAQNGPLTITKSYDKGFVTQIKYDKTANSTNILTLNTVFDKAKSNLTSRTNNQFNWNESFQYDEQDRLTKFANVQSIQVTQTYDDKGRILQNSLGTYNYDPGKPYRNSSVDLTPEAISYYSDRTQTAEKKLNVRYNVFKSPVTIEEAGIDKISFDYNDNNDRTTMFYGSLHEHTDKLLRPNRKYYSSDGSMEIKQNINSGIFEFVTYIGGDGYSAPIAFKSDGDTNRNYLYLQRDYQGSILSITNENGDILEKRLFDAWGDILKVQDGAGNSLAGLTVLDRGYTGHEHLQSVSIIHMNGRLYDPKLHRFLQPDNYVQDPFNTQNYNRYGYCWNNPFKYTDPNGEWVHIVVGAVIGGLVNWGAHGFRMDMEGLKAFGIGAGAGALGAATGGMAFAAAGGAAGGAGGFAAGAFSGAIGTAFSSAFLSTGNSVVLGDPMMSGKEFITGVAIGALTGGTFNGISALVNGRTFWTGVDPTPKVQPLTISIQSAGLTEGGKAEIRTGDYTITGTTEPIEFTTSSTSMAPSRNYTIYEADGTLHKFGVSDADFYRMNQSLKMAGEGATAKFSDVIPKFQAHINETYMRSLHYNSTGIWKINGMKYPYPRSFETGIRISKP